MRENASTNVNSLTLALTPALFVWLWSTGFIGAKLGMPYAEPFYVSSYSLCADHSGVRPHGVCLRVQNGRTRQAHGGMRLWLVC